MTGQDVITQLIEDPESSLRREHCHYVVCDACHGEGTTSAYVGAYTESEWAEMDDEWQDDYLSGAFDRVCERCEGNRVILELLDTAPAEAREALADWYATEAMYAAERRMGA